MLRQRVNSLGSRSGVLADSLAQRTGCHNVAVPEPEEIELPAEFRIPRIAYFAAFMMGVTCLVIAGVSLVWFGWTLVIPILLAFWIHRLRTIVTDEGVTAVNLRGRRSATWDEISGLQFPRWFAVRAVLKDKSKIALPAITFRDLPRLSAASRGRIPDPYAIDSPDAERIESEGETASDRGRKSPTKPVGTEKAQADTEPEKPVDQGDGPDAE